MEPKTRGCVFVFMTKREKKEKNRIVNSNYILLNCADSGFLDRLKDEEAGIIFKALFTYRATGTKPDLGGDRYVEFVFDRFSVSIDRYFNCVNELQEEQVREEIGEELMKDTPRKIVEVVTNGKVQKFDLTASTETVNETKRPRINTSSELVFSTESPKDDKLDEDEEIVLWCIQEAAKTKKYPIRSDGYQRVPVSYITGQCCLSKGANLSSIKKSLKDKGYIDYRKDEEQRFHIFKVLKSYKFRIAV